METLECAVMVQYDTLEEAKSEWSFTKRVFETGDLTQEEFDKMPKPRYQQIKQRCKLIFADQPLLHEKE